MASRRYDVKPGPIKRMIIKELMAGPSRWKDLWSNETIRNLSRSPRKLSEALTELQKEGLIEKRLISYRNQPYFLTKDAEAIRITEGIEKALNQIGDAMRQIEQYREEPKISEADFEVIKSMLFDAELVFLRTVDVLSDIGLPARPYVESWFQDEVLSNIIEMILACYKILPKTTKRAMNLFKKEAIANRPTPKIAQDETLAKINEIFQRGIVNLVSLD
jgi:DNA-binding HxlR family transcriptional regulator